MLWAVQPASGLAQENDPQRQLTNQAGDAQVQPRISRREAARLAQEAFSGRVLSIRLERGFWRVRMDEDGKVFNVRVNAQSGEVSAAD